MTRRFAVVFSGGMSEPYNYIRYANDIQLSLDWLSARAGYSLSDTFVLLSSGGRQFNAYGQTLTARRARVEDLVAVAAEVVSKAEPGDQFFFFSTNHGGRLSRGMPSVKLWCWDETYISDVDFASLWQPLRAAFQLYLLVQCYSGGFIPSLATKSRAILTACAWDEVSYARSALDYDEFPYLFFHAFNRGATTIADAFQFAKSMDTKRESPQFSDPSNLASSSLVFV